MKILITGGAGFIGNHLTHFLMQNGHDVYVIDKKISNLLPPTKQKIDDIIDVDENDSFFDNFDMCIHLAALVSVQKSINKPINSFGDNVFSTIKILEICRKHNIKKLFFSSSAAVYGSKEGETSEMDETIPVSPYGLDKLTCEKYIQMYCSMWNIDYLILRFFNVFGEGQNPEYASVITAFNLAKQKGEPLIIYGDGEQTRDFIKVGDVCSYIIFLMNKGVKNEIFNIGTGNGISVNEVAKQFNCPIIYKEARNEIKHSRANMKKLNSLLTQFSDSK